MSVRRQFISDELRYSHQTSPRKSRTFRGSSLFQPTILYRGDIDTVKEEIPNSWVGRKLIPWNGEYIQSYIRSVQLGKNDPTVVSEFEIANYCKSNSYRILYVFFDLNGQMIVKSKPQIDFVPGRMNLFLTTDDVIRKIAYF